MRQKILYGIFFLSGIAGLTYEVLWMRYFSLLFGNTAKGAAMVLIVFFLGMAIGNGWGGRRVGRAKDPLRFYAGVEFGIALAAAPIPLLLPFYEAIYPWLYRTLEASPVFLDWVRFLMALVMTLPAGIFLGATFPVMAEIVIRKKSEFGRMSGLLYGLNTLGAAGGVVLSGFFLPPLLGISLSYGLAVLMNLILGSVLILLPKASVSFGQSSGAKIDREPDPAPGMINEKKSPLPDWLLLVIAFGSGLGMISLEVLWTRMLALVFHNSVYSFSAIILIVLIGLSFSGFLMSAIQKKIPHPAGVLSLSLALTALLVLSTPFIFYKATGLAYFAYGAGWPGYLIQVLLLTAGIILLPVLSAGLSLPLVWGMYGQAARSAGKSIGEVNLINLLGGIVGGGLAGFLLIPSLGLWKGITAVAVLYLILSQITVSYVFASRSSPWIRRLASFAVILFVGMAVFITNPSLYPVQRLKAGERLLYLNEGEDAVVSVVEDASRIRWLKSNNTYHLGATAAVRGEKRLGHLPLLLHPSPKKTAFVGIGTGISMSAGLDHPTEELLGIEILPGVMEAVPYFSEHNLDLLKQERVRTVVGDGRVYLKSTDKQFDVVVSDLFVPWHAGTGSLYTQEHFEAVRDHLAPGGLFCQWLPLYQMSEWDFGAVAATFAKAFPHVSVWRGDFSSKAPILGLVGSVEPITLNEQGLDARLKAVREKSALEDPLLRNFSDFTLLYGGDLKSMEAWLSEFPINTENHPIIEYQSPTYQAEGIMFNREAIAAFYSQLEEGAVSVAGRSFGESALLQETTSLSPAPGNLLFQAVEAGLAQDIERQLTTIKEAVQLLPNSNYLKVLNVVLNAVDSGGTRGVVQKQAE